MQELNIRYSTDLHTNMTEVEREIVLNNEKYLHLVVTSDTVKSSKTIIADLRKQKRTIARKCIDFKTECEKKIFPILDGRKRIENHIDNIINAISSQITKYEIETKSKITAKINLYIDEICKEKGVDTALFSAEKYSKLTAVTSGLSLTSTTKELIYADLIKIENEMLNAKIAENERIEHERKIAEAARIEYQRKIAEEARIEHERKIAENERIEHERKTDKIQENIKQLAPEQLNKFGPGVSLEDQLKEVDRLRQDIIDRENKESEIAVRRENNDFTVDVHFLFSKKILPNSKLSKDEDLTQECAYLNSIIDMHLRDTDIYKNLVSIVVKPVAIQKL